MLKSALRVEQRRASRASKQERTTNGSAGWQCQWGSRCSQPFWESIRRASGEMVKVDGSGDVGVVFGLKWSSAAIPLRLGLISMDSGKNGCLNWQRIGSTCSQVQFHERKGAAVQLAFQWLIDVGSRCPQDAGVLNLPSVGWWRTLHRPLELCEIGANDRYELQLWYVSQVGGILCFRPICPR